MQPSFIPGDQFAGYRIEAFIARGGMAVVYCASDDRLNRRVALKLLAPELTENDNFRQRFIRESKLAASIDHPHIIPIYRAGQVDDVLYLAMRYVNGPDLSGLLAQEGPLPLPRAIALFSQVAGALDAAHAHALVHRDVKPANVLVAAGPDTGEVPHLYLTDFGLTKRVASLSGLTLAGHFLGTVDYVSPEQIAGQPTDARTDVYSLGCVLFEALTGDRPFDRDVEAATIYAHLTEPPPPVSSKRGDLPPQIDDIVGQAMAKEPDARFRSCEALISALRAISNAPSRTNRRPPFRSSAQQARTVPTRDYPSPSLPPPTIGAMGGGVPTSAVDQLTDRRPSQLPRASLPPADSHRPLMLIRGALILLVVVLLFLMFANL